MICEVVEKVMECYYLTKDTFSRGLFVPHDFVIKQLNVSSEELTFVFEDDITYHDGIKELFPGKKSLILRFHLIDETLLVCREKRKHFLWQKHGYFDFDERKLPGLCGKNLNILITFFLINL